jgi:hypothetical protein
MPAGEKTVAGTESGMLGVTKDGDKPKTQPISTEAGQRQVDVKAWPVSFEIPTNEGGKCQEGVKVGDIMVHLGDRGGKDDGLGAQKQGVEKQEGCGTVVRQDPRIYVRSYKPAPDDVEWARCGVVATIANGEAGSVVRRRLGDAGFKGLDLIHLGGARVLVRSQDGTDVMSILDGAKEFFSMCFSHWVRWEMAEIPFQRGAWVRLYGIPLHAWNDNFFKLCVMDCGRFLRTDGYTAAKDRLDFARVLIATSAMAVIKKVEHLMVDGALVGVQIIEEWGFELGDDACLLEEDTVSKASQAAEDDYQCDPEASKQVDMLIDQFAKGVTGESYSQGDDTQSVEIPVRGQSGGEDERAPAVNQPAASDASVVAVSGHNMHTRAGHNGSLRVAKEDGAVGKRNRTTSCPPAGRSALSGPWSLEWLSEHNCGGAGGLPSSKKQNKEGSVAGGERHKQAVKGRPKTTTGGFIHHSLCSLKRIARLPINDRREVLQILRKNARRRRPSGSSSRSRASGNRTSAEDVNSSSTVNNDWKHWVAMQGKDNAIEEDVLEVGNFIGATFKGDKANKFSVLSKSGTSKRVSSGVVQGRVSLQERAGLGALLGEGRD